MPWDASDAKSKTKKANTSKKTRQWERVANSVLSHGESDVTAIKEANGVVKKSKKPAKFNMRKGYTDHGKAF